MKKKLFCTASLWLFSCLMVMADYVPTAYYTVEGEDLESTDFITDAEAPLTVTFKANPSDLGELTPAYEWRFYKDGQLTPFLVRYEENTVYEFKESGTTTVSLYVSYDEETEPELVASIKVTISTSLLEMPNAFSPNGDGYNDIYNAKPEFQSIVSFKATIFNRWGQKIYSWTNPDREKDGWDGTWKGRKVRDGVYFVVVSAQGADGHKYSIRKDVNVLTGYDNGANGGGEEP